MPFIDPEFTPLTLSEEDKYEGTEVDDNVRKGISLANYSCNQL